MVLAAAGAIVPRHGIGGAWLEVAAEHVDLLHADISARTMRPMLDPSIKQLPTSKRCARFCGHLPNGEIASHVMWGDATDDHLLINTEVHRAKYRAVEANPNV